MSFTLPFSEDLDLSENTVVLSGVFIEQVVTLILWQMAIIISRPKLLWYKEGEFEVEEEEERG
jgi:hypothetical protein